MRASIGGAMTDDFGGFSPDRLARVRAVLDGALDRSDIAGAVSIIYRRGKIIRVDVAGLQDRERGVKMCRDTIFRIASMSKPITAVALLILMEEGVLRLDDPVATWLPELADVRVLRSPDGDLNDTRALERPISVRDLVTFKLGTGLPAPWDNSNLAIAMRDLGLVSDRLGALCLNNDEWLARLGTLPLACQPGERWLYHFGSEILSILMSRATDISFDALLHSRIFAPLKMHDTGFFVAQEKLDRLSACYKRDRKTRKLVLHDDPLKGDWSTPPIFQSGGGGLVSTADDYLTFGRMLLGNGTLEGARILSRASVELMATNHLTPRQKSDPFFFWPNQWRGRGFGFGVSVGIERDEIWSNSRPA